MAYIPKDSGPPDGKWQFVGSVDKPVVEIQITYGVLKVLHPDGTHSLLVAPEDRAELTGDLI